MFQKGHLVSNELRIILSEVNKGNTNMLGKHLSIETKRKMSEYQKGKSLSNETKRKLSLSAKGRIFSKETRDKLSESLKGRISPMKGRNHSKKTKIKISNANRGENSGRWKGGITSLKLLIHSNIKYRQWRDDIYTRDNFTCQKCGEKGGKLNAHHIKSFSNILQEYEITTFEEALNCAELWNTNNGITYCEGCHKETDNYARNTKVVKIEDD